MKVFKFGGASVKDAESVRNVVRVIKHHDKDHLVVVISAMGKMTNAFEKLVKSYFEKADWEKQLLEIKRYHSDIMYALFNDYNHEAFATAEKIYDYIRLFLQQEDMDNYDYVYDQIVPAGELLSTKIVNAYLNHEKVNSTWYDARKLVITDNTYRTAKVDWDATSKKLNETFDAWKESSGKKRNIAITQGFIGGGDHNRMTTLGREGSDYTAAIIAYSLDAEEVSIWKDVPGVLNADPKWFNNTIKLGNISYKEAIELAYYGASVIHPKTIQPLQQKDIPLYVNSFVDYQEEGTLINKETGRDTDIPSYIFKTDQVLISISSRDFSFMVEENISELFRCFADHRVKISTMQNSAISFSVVVDSDPERLPKLIEALQKNYKVLYNEGLELLTIRHYNQNIIDQLVSKKDVLLEQKSRQTVRILMKGETYKEKTSA